MISFSTLIRNVHFEPLTVPLPKRGLKLDPKQSVVCEGEVLSQLRHRDAKTLSELFEARKIEIEWSINGEFDEGCYIAKSIELKKLRSNFKRYNTIELEPEDATEEIPERPVTKIEVEDIEPEENDHADSVEFRGADTVRMDRDEDGNLIATNEDGKTLSTKKLAESNEVEDVTIEVKSSRDLADNKKPEKPKKSKKRNKAIENPANLLEKHGDDKFNKRKASPTEGFEGGKDDFMSGKGKKFTPPVSGPVEES